MGSVILWVTSADTTLPRSMLGVSQSVFSLLQKNVLDRRIWATREELRIAISCSESVAASSTNGRIGPAAVGVATAAGGRQHTDGGERIRETRHPKL